ncbi:tyrosine-type recombinase/integrase [Sulfurovum sp. NBC37-1]|uniref:tyrosine-type recombinase/integrase n=1 Tax=Sulfurovum sp. (strain NBC37-1) TaxID=387093 RepID=UPI0001587B04|nr:integrase arm-type DNA-binding domain-containing protein [Sulfurovum sp. NBC37-1]BAF73348.1 site-specific recombinase, phage integrase family [Sulfurovum sp. NBC37-1]
MARITNPLTDKEIKAAKPKEKEYKLFDGGGLYLSITPKGQKWWRLKYRFDGKEKRISLGVYPNTSLQDARQQREDFKTQIAKGIDPSRERKEKKEAVKAEVFKSRNTFKSICLEWIELQRPQMAEATLSKYERTLEKDFYAPLGDKSMNDITRHDLITIAQVIQDRGAVETAHRSLGLCNRIWRYALQFDKVGHNIVSDISKKDVLRSYKNKSFKTITDEVRIGELMNAIDNYTGEFTTKSALRLLPLTFVRPHNIRYAEWSEFDLENGIWTIPAEKMKMKKEHKLPLAPQAVKILKEIYPYTNDAKYVFHSPISRLKAISENTLNMALKRLDFGGEIVSHGFRAMFSTLAYESGKFRSEVIEDLLAHQEANQVKKAYNRAAYDAEKREIVEWYADYLENVKIKERINK